MVHRHMSTTLDIGMKTCGFYDTTDTHTDDSILLHMLHLALAKSAKNLLSVLERTWVLLKIEFITKKG